MRRLGANRGAPAESAYILTLSTVFLDIELSQQGDSGISLPATLRSPLSWLNNTSISTGGMARSQQRLQLQMLERNVQNYQLSFEKEDKRL